MGERLADWLARLLASFARPTHPDARAPAPAAPAPAQPPVAPPARPMGTIRQGTAVVDTVWVHCSATRREWMAGSPVGEKVAEIRRWHRDRGWRDIGYHWIIDRDGSIAPGRPETQVGAHVAGHNTGSLGVCLIGGHGSQSTDAFADHYTDAQRRALRQIIADIRSRTPLKAVRGHNEVAAKACPGFTVRQGDWL